MKITRIIEDNGMKIMHVQYTKAEVAEAVKKAKEHKAAMDKKLQGRLDEGKDKEENVD